MKTLSVGYPNLIDFATYMITEWIIKQLEHHSILKEQPTQCGEICPLETGWIVKEYLNSDDTIQMWIEVFYPLLVSLTMEDYGCCQLAQNLEVTEASA